MSLSFGEKQFLSQFVQLVRHMGDYVSSCWEVDYQQIKHFQLLQGDVTFPCTQADSLQGTWGGWSSSPSMGQTQNSTKFLCSSLSSSQSSCISLHRGFWLFHGGLQLSDASNYSNSPAEIAAPDRAYFSEVFLLLQSCSCLLQAEECRWENECVKIMWNFYSVSRTKMCLAQLGAGFGPGSITHEAAMATSVCVINLLTVFLWKGITALVRHEFLIRFY